MTSDANDFVNAKKETSARRVQKLRSIRQKKANAHMRKTKKREKPWGRGCMLQKPAEPSSALLSSLASVLCLHPFLRDAYLNYF